MLKTHSTRHTLILYLVCFRSMYWLKLWMIVWWWICCCCCWCCRRRRCRRFTFSNYSYCVLLPLCMQLKVDVVWPNAISFLHELKHTHKLQCYFVMIKGDRYSNGNDDQEIFPLNLYILIWINFIFKKFTGQKEIGNLH